MTYSAKFLIDKTKKYVRQIINIAEYVMGLHFVEIMVAAFINITCCQYFQNLLTNQNFMQIAHRPHLKNKGWELK